MRLSDAISLTLLLFIISFKCYAQRDAEHEINVNISEVALLEVLAGSGGEVNFNGVAPNTSGQKIRISNKAGSGVWLNYSSIVGPNQFRTVTATVLGNIPAGIVLKVKTSECKGVGRGLVGQTLNEKELSNSPVNIITGIGSCFTGQGEQNGHELSYSLELNDDAYGLLERKETSLQILYTLTDVN